MRTGQQACNVWKQIYRVTVNQVLNGRWRRLGMVLLILLPFLVPHSEVAVAQTQASSQFQIQFKARHFTPTPGLEIEAIQNQYTDQSAQAANQAGNLDLGYSLYFPVIQGGEGEQTSDNIHFLLQFENLPSPSDEQQLAHQGIQLLTYVIGNTYIAATNVSNLDAVQKLPTVRWAGPLEAEDKLSPDLKSGIIGDWAKTPDGREVLSVQFHQDVDITQAEAFITELGGEIHGVAPTIPAIAAIFAPGQAQQIAQSNIVQYVDALEPRLESHNDGARVAANVTPLTQAPYNLTGNGVTVLVYDVGRVDAGHPDFGTRIIQDDGSAIADHATHVAGTVGGRGANSNGNDSVGNPNGGIVNQWAGMAPGVNIRSFGDSGGDGFYDNGGDLNGDFTTAINNGIDLATMSLGNNVVRNGLPCGQLGDYTNTAILIDNIVRGSIAGQQLIYVESAGNERNGSFAACNLTFNTISSPATAKNSIAVGAVNSNDSSITTFTSFGPTDDGRIKPDITAPGCQSTGDFAITSPSFIDAPPPGPPPPAGTPTPTPNGILDPNETRNAPVCL